MTTPPLPVGPGVPRELQSLLNSFRACIVELQQPTQPHPLWSHPTAATLQATAPAASYPTGCCIVEDINSIAVSTLVGGSYVWRRADGSAL